jgi:DNA (cytosine-5)-methyltransferase 1
MITELSLFTGAGGGLLGTKLLGFTPVGYVERNDHCQKQIRARVIDGLLDDAPIFGDIKTFIEEGYAGAYSGMVDIITAGFPCQPFAAGGFRLGQNDERNRWPETLECIRIVRPRGALLENSAKIITHPYFGEILFGLASLGYACEWDVFSACMFGAPQTRDRMFLLAYPDSEHGKKWVGSVADKRALPERDYRAVLENWMGTVSRNAGSGSGVADRVERTKAIGNGQVPVVVRNAWEYLSTAAYKHEQVV